MKNEILCERTISGIGIIIIRFENIRIGGQCIFITPDKDNPRERYLAYLAYGSVKVPFRKPKREVKNVLDAITKFAENWKRIIGENLDTHHDLVDWSVEVRFLDVQFSKTKDA